MRRIPLSHRSHVVGFQSLPRGCTEHESALERDFVTLASFIDRSAEIIAQPLTIRFIEGGRVRRYTPDFEVRWSTGDVDIVEVKYRADLRAQWPRLRPAFAAMRAVLPSRSARFRIVTERGIRGPDLVVAKRLVPLRGAPIDPVLAARAHAAVGISGATFAMLIDALGEPKSAGLATIWRLLASGSLCTDFSVPVVAGSRISGRERA